MLIFNSRIIIEFVQITTSSQHMGSFCPCFSRARHDKTKKTSYDVHEAFEISESISDLSTVKHRGFEELNEEAADHTDRKETEETSIKASE